MSEQAERNQHHLPEQGPSDATVTNQVVSRRQVMKAGAAGIAAAGAGGVVLGTRGLRSGASAAGSTSGAARLSTGAKQEQNGGTLVVGWEEDTSTLDPAKTVCGHEVRIVNLFADTLWGLEGSSSELMPHLATEWSASEDGLVWTVDLRPDVLFHDGTVCDAEAVKWSFDRWLDPDHPYHDPPYGLLTYYLSVIESVEVVDPLKLRFTLSELDSTYETRMVVGYAAIVSPTAVEEMGNTEFGQLPVATGPFRVSQWERGVRIVLDRFDDYWGQPARLDQVVIRPIVENAARLAALQQGEVDLIVAMSPEFIPEIEADPNLQLIQSVGNHIWWITFNMHDEILQDVRVRQALNYAVDKEAIIDTILQGAATLTGGPMIGHSWGNDPEVQPYPYDPERARALLEEAGYADGFTTRFWVPESGSGMIAPREIAQVVQADLANVGVTVELVTQEWTSYVADYGGVGLDTDNYGMAEMSWNFSSPDPAEWLNPNVKSDAQPPEAFNGGYYANPEVDDLLAQALGTADQEERAALYRQAQAVMHEDCPWLFMFSANNIAAASINVQGVELNPSPSVVSLHFASFVE